MRTVHKRTPVLHAKALNGGDSPGTFEAIVAVYGNEDADGDAVEAGAFTESIAAELPPIVWSHDWLTPPIGATLEMSELGTEDLGRLVGGVPAGATGALYGKGRLLVDTESGEDVPLARHVYAAMKAQGGDGRSMLREFSWGGQVLAEAPQIRDPQPPLWLLQKIALDEWGPCLKGVNPDTALVAVKAEAVRSKVYLTGREIAEAIERMAAEKAARHEAPEHLRVEHKADAEPDEDTAETEPEVAKGALPVSNLPLAARDRAWDNGAAKARVHGWAEKASGGYDRAKLEKAYLWRDGGAPPDQVTSYRFIVTDIVGGELTYVPTGIQTAANVLMGGRGGTTIGDSGVAELKSSVGRLYARMAREFDDAQIVAPWANDGGAAAGNKSAAADPEQRLAIAGLLLP